MEAKQEKAPQKLQRQVLKELEDKLGDLNAQQSASHPSSEKNNIDSELVRTAKIRPQTQEGIGRDDPLPNRYTDIPNKEETNGHRHRTKIEPSN